MQPVLSALIFTQTLIKDRVDFYFLWLTQEPTSKHVETLALFEILIQTGSKCDLDNGTTWENNSEIDASMKIEMAGIQD